MKRKETEYAVCVYRNAFKQFTSSGPDLSASCILCLRPCSLEPRIPSSQLPLLKPPVSQHEFKRLSPLGSVVSVHLLVIRCAFIHLLIRPPFQTQIFPLPNPIRTYAIVSSTQALHDFPTQFNTRSSTGLQKDPSLGIKRMHIVRPHTSRLAHIGQKNHRCKLGM